MTTRNVRLAAVASVCLLLIVLIQAVPPLILVVSGCSFPNCQGGGPNNYCVQPVPNPCGYEFGTCSNTNPDPDCLGETIVSVKYVSPGYNFAYCLDTGGPNSSSGLKPVACAIIHAYKEANCQGSFATSQTWGCSAQGDCCSGQNCIGLP